jgi:L-asparaginase II
MANPVVAQVLRGSLVESRHRGSVAVVDAEGAVVLGLGDLDTLVYPRSAVKAMQALVLMEAGAAERFNLADDALALACASHGGEPGHVAVVERMLAAAGTGPVGPWLRRAMAQPRGARRRRSRVAAKTLPHCITTAQESMPALSARRARSESITCGYTEAAHPVQRAVKAVLQDLTGAAIPDERRAVDGCSVPTLGDPAQGACARLRPVRKRQGDGTGTRQGGAAIARSVRGEPWHVAGTAASAPR